MWGFYKGLLGSCASELPAIDLHTVRTGATLSRAACETLIKPVTEEETDEALHKIDDAKTPPMDGFNSVFFKKCWSFIKDDVYGAVEEFF